MAQFVLAINGREHVIDGDADDRLLPILRDELGLTGTKFGCGEGQCGACTVLVDGQATRSCVARLSAVSGRPITTIEGLGTPDRPHPVQQAFLDVEALQCGYCTPGMIMAVVSLLRATPHPTEADIARVLDRNVCRCGTFPRIVRAIQDAATRLADAGTGARA
jgi:aerobic-type carbon monoxide dehydrogenase small subunit (CoxS/CutS family)